MNNLILIDDRQDFIDAFTNDCAARQYALYSKRSLVGLKELMPVMHHRAACVILDIKCLHDENQEIEDSSFIGSALTYLNQHYPRFPRVILTGDDKEYEQIQRYHRDEDIFLKTPEDKERLFLKLKFYIDNSDQLRVERENPEPFECFQPGILPEAKRTIFYRLLKKSYDAAFERNDFNTIREFIEDVFLWANSKSLLPSACIKSDGRPNLEWSYRYLSGLPVHVPGHSRPLQAPSILPAHVSRTLEMVKHNSSILSHSYSDKVTLNAFKATLFGLAETLVWCKDFSKARFGI